MNEIEEDIKQKVDFFISYYLFRLHGVIENDLDEWFACDEDSLHGKLIDINKTYKIWFDEKIAYRVGFLISCDPRVN